MESALSSNSKTTVIQKDLQVHNTSQRNNECCSETSHSTLHQYHKSDRYDTPSSKSDITLPPPSSYKDSLFQTNEDLKTDEEGEDNKLDWTDKTTGEGNIESEGTSINEEHGSYRREKFEILKRTAIHVVALEKRHEEDGSFTSEINDASVLFNDTQAALRQTGRKHIHQQFTNELAQLMIETGFFNLSCEIVIYTHKNGWYLADGNVDLNKYTQLRYSIMNLQNFSDSSDDFAIALANEHGIISTLKQMLEDFKEESNEEEIEKLIANALGIAHNISMRESNVSKLRDVGMMAYLKPYLKSQNDGNALLALACLAGIINEDECDVINSNKDKVVYLLDCIRKGLKDDMRRYDGWSCKECGFIIKLLTRNDGNVKTLVELGALELLVELGRTGDEDEQFESVSALWKMCFDEVNQTLITGKPELGVVDLLVDLKSSENDKIRKACNGALWTLRDALKKTVVKKYMEIGEQLSADREKKEKIEEKNSQIRSKDKIMSKGHVMISYQWADQEVLKNVRDNINNRGYQVWIDIDQMGGSTLQAMADAVEGAAVFLMCMSNKYKHSPSCRAEAEYAYQLQKHIIPLKMERGYKPDGWLGFLLGAKLYFEFSPKYSFEDKMKSLLKEIDGVLGEAVDMSDLGMIIAHQIPSETEDVIVHSVSNADLASSKGNPAARMSSSKTTFEIVSKWTPTDVKGWIEKHGLQKCKMKGLTGREIALLANMRMECPEYFYKCLELKLKIKDLLTMSKVVSALHDLS